MLPAAPVTRTRIGSDAAGRSRPSSSPIREAAARPASRTSSWLSGSPVMPAARLVTRRDAEHLHAGLAGGDRLERGATCRPGRRRSRGPSDLGRGLVVRAGELHVDALVEAGSTSRHSARSRLAVEVGEVDEVRALDRARCAVRLMWSLISTGVPGVQVSLRPPQPLVSTIVAAAGRGGGADAVHDGARRPGPRRSGCGRGRPAGCVSPARTERILPAWPATAAAAKPGRSVVADLGGGLAQRVDGRQPAGAQHQGDVVALDAGQLGEHGRRPLRRARCGAVVCVSVTRGL